MNFHVRRGPLGAFGNGFAELFLKYLKHLQFAGIMKKIMTTRMAGVASLTLLKSKEQIQRRSRDKFQSTHIVRPRSLGHPSMNPGARKKNNTTAKRNRKATQIS